MIILAACNHEREALQEDVDMGITIDSLACGEPIDWFSMTGPIYLIDRLEELRKLHESSMGIGGRAYTMTVIVSDDVPDGKYLLTPMTPPVDYFLFVSVKAFAVSPIGDMAKYLIIEKVCE